MQLVRTYTENTDDGQLEIRVYQDGEKAIVDTVFPDGTILRRSESGARWIFPDHQAGHQEKRRPWWRFW